MRPVLIPARGWRNGLAARAARQRAVQMNGRRPGKPGLQDPAYGALRYFYLKIVIFPDCSAQGQSLEWGLWGKLNIQSFDMNLPVRQGLRQDGNKNAHILPYMLRFLFPPFLDLRKNS